MTATALDAPPSRPKASTGPDGRFLVFTATYNERDNIEEFCSRVLTLDPRIRLLVVDDNSPDGTGAVLDRLERETGRIIALHRPRKLGLGSAHKLAMLYAIRNRYDILITMDSDLSHDPAHIPEMLAALAAHDFVIGSRYMKGGKSDYRGYRRAVSILANLAGRLVLGLPLHELTTSFRAFRTAALRELELSSIRSQGYSFFIESLYRIARLGLCCGEVPIHFHDRKAGASKIPRLEILHGMRKLLGLAWVRCIGEKAPRRDRLSGLVCASCRSPYILEEPVRAGSARDEACTASCLACGEWGTFSPEVLAEVRPSWHAEAMLAPR